MYDESIKDRSTKRKVWLEVGVRLASSERGDGDELEFDYRKAS